MADSFFGFDTSLSNLNDDEGGGEPSEDEYDALNDETFGQDSDAFDWEVEHEQLAEQLESSRRHNIDIDETASTIEASLSQLVLDETDAPQPRTFGSSVWRHETPFPSAPTPVPTLKNVCTVEELERQLRQKQAQAQTYAHNYYHPRFPVILQRPPGLQAPVPLPFAPQQNMSHNIIGQTNQMSQSLNKIIGQSNQMNQLNQNSLMQNQMGQNVNQIGSMNQMGQNMNQMNQNMNQMNQNMNHNMNQIGQNVNQFMQNANHLGSFQNSQLGQSNMMNLSQNMQVHQMSQTNQLLQNQMGQNMKSLSQNVNQMNMNQMGQNINPIGQKVSQMGQNVNQMGQGLNHMSQGVNQIGPGVNQMAPGVNQMGPGVNQMGPGVNQMGPGVNQMGPGVNQMGPGVNQMGPGVNQMGQGVNQMGGQNVNQINQNQILPNGNQFNTGVNQFPQMMNQSRMMGPPPGMNIPRQNFNSNVSQFNPSFRTLPVSSKPNDQQTINQQSMLINQQMHQMKSQSTQMNQPKPASQSNQPIGPPVNQQIGPPVNQQIGPSVNQSPQNKMVQNQNQKTQNRSDPKIQKSRVYNNSQKNMTPQNLTSQNLTSQNMASHNMTSQNMASHNMTSQNMASQNMASQNMASQNMASQNMASQNMASQNLVQLIQNTHPMLQYNNSYHNANHHPMLNNRSSMFNSSQFVNSNFFNNQRHNGVYSNNNRHSMNGDDCSSSDSDEYAGLMTPREKQWLINIQMLQLNTGTPYIHDFYYTVFLERQESKEKDGIKEAHKANQQNHPFYSGGNLSVKQETHTHRERHNSNRHNSTGDDAPPRTYVPAQFENSLGKLQCGSVTAPRKIIDVEVVSNEQPSGRVSRAASVASTTNPAEVPREVKRTKQLLLDIEALYLILLRLEELNDPLAISNAVILKEREEKQKQLEQAQKEALENEHEEDSNVFLRNIESVQRRPKQDSPKSESIDKRQVVNLAVNQKPAPVKNLLDEDKDDLINKMFIGLLHSDRLQQILTVRKGRTLVSRFLARAPGGHTRVRSLWCRALRALPAAARRHDGGLAALAPHYRRYIQSTTGWSPILESCGLLAESFDPARTPYALTTSFTLSCVCSLVEKATALCSTPEATSNERQWSKFLKTLARALKNTTLNVSKPIHPLPESKLMYHLKQLESRSPIEILQRGKTTAEFADISKTDVTEQLLKHLC